MRGRVLSVVRRGRTWQGVHPKLVSEMLGHARVGITLDLYSHVTQHMHAEAARRIGRVLFADV